MLFFKIINDNSNITINKPSLLIDFEDSLYFSCLYKKEIEITLRELVNTTK